MAPQVPSIRDEQLPHDPYPAVPPQDQEEEENRKAEESAVETAADMVDGALEVADASASCFEWVPDLDCAVVDCDPGCA
jgi:hypothetical protein